MVEIALIEPKHKMNVIFLGSKQQHTDKVTIGKTYVIRKLTDTLFYVLNDIDEPIYFESLLTTHWEVVK